MSPWWYHHPTFCLPKEREFKKVTERWFAASEMTAADSGRERDSPSAAAVWLWPILPPVILMDLSTWEQQQRKQLQLSLSGCASASVAGERQTFPGRQWPYPAADVWNRSDERCCGSAYRHRGAGEPVLPTAATRLPRRHLKLDEGLSRRCCLEER